MAGFSSNLVAAPLSGGVHIATPLVPNTAQNFSSRTASSDATRDYFSTPITRPVMSRLCNEADASKVDAAQVLSLIRDELQDSEDWEIAVAILPERCAITEFYRVIDIVHVVGNTRREAIARLAGELWPKLKRGNGNGNYQMTIEMASQLIRAYLFIGRKRHTRDEIEELLAAKILRDFRKRLRKIHS